MNFLAIEILQCKISSYSSPCDKALLSVEQDFIPEPETKHLIGSLIPFTDTTLNGIDLMQLPVMMPNGSDTIERIAGLCVRHTSDATGDELASGIYAQRDILFIFAAAVQQANGKRGTPDHCCLVVSQHDASLPWGARHQRLAVLVEYIHIH